MKMVDQREGREMRKKKLIDKIAMKYERYCLKIIRMTWIWKKKKLPIRKNIVEKLGGKEKESGRKERATNEDHLAGPPQVNRGSSCLCFRLSCFITAPGVPLLGSSNSGRRLLSGQSDLVFTCVAVVFMSVSSWLFFC